jgi:hypothetical protein
MLMDLLSTEMACNVFKHVTDSPSYGFVELLLVNSQHMLNYIHAIVIKSVIIG